MAIGGSDHSVVVRRLRRILSPIPWRLIRRDDPRRVPHDRYLLEHVIFPQLLARSDLRDFLFVGTDIYTATYPAIFSERHFVTLDIDPSKARYGANKHVVDTFANVAAHFHPRSLDAVICNGVIGWGLNEKNEIEAAMRQSFTCLRPGGILIIGWDDIPPWRPVPLDQIEGLRAFVPMTFPPFPTPTYPTLGELRHVFNFYRRPTT